MGAMERRQHGSMALFGGFERPELFIDCGCNSFENEYITIYLNINNIDIFLCLGFRLIY